MPDTEIAIFPLASVVLFPGIQVPLHVFEPRYREMTADALSSGGEIGMAVVPPEHAHAMGGDPPLHPIGCAGSIAQHQRLPDGRYNMILHGTRRFRLLDEAGRAPGRLYRWARIEPLEDPYPETAHAAVAELRPLIVEHVVALVRRTDPERAVQIADDRFHGVDGALFVNSLCQAIPFGIDEKLALLDAPDVASRCELLEGLLSLRVAGLSGAGAAGSSSIH